MDIFLNLKSFFMAFSIDVLCILDILIHCFFSLHVNACDVI